MSALDDAISKLIKNVVLKAVIAALISAVPFLGIPGINLITTWLVMKIGGLVIETLQKFIDFKIIDWKTDAENAAYQNAVAALKAAQATGDANATEKAKADFKSTLSKLIHFDT